MNETIKTFGYPETLIKEYDHWVMLLRPQQITIGTLVLVSKSQATHLGQLSEQEWTEFARVSQDAEMFTGDIFGAEKFNYLALMMKDPNVHFHFVPRYSKPVELNGKTFIDPDWPLKTEFKPMEISSEDFDHIKLRLKPS